MERLTLHSVRHSASAFFLPLKASVVRRKAAQGRKPFSSFPSFPTSLFIAKQAPAALIFLLLRIALIVFGAVFFFFFSFTKIYSEFVLEWSRKKVHARHFAIEKKGQQEAKLGLRLEIKNKNV